MMSTVALFVTVEPLRGLRKRQEHPSYVAVGVWHLLPLLDINRKIDSISIDSIDGELS